VEGGGRTDNLRSAGIHYHSSLITPFRHYMKASEKRAARDERKGAHLRRMFDHYTEWFRAVPNQDPAAVAREAHAAIDKVLERDRQKSAASGDIRCRRGCGHCCRGPVEVWPQEAELLIETAREAGMELDRARLERQSHYTPDTWQQQPAADTACVFLGDDGACTVYEFRPNACRKLLVVTDPALCDAQKHPPDSVGRWYSWEAEVLESAALEVFGATLMPRLLLAGLQQADGDTRTLKE
jgi:Fe-S-cluster containining protein